MKVTGMEQKGKINKVSIQIPMKAQYIYFLFTKSLQRGTSTYHQNFEEHKIDSKMALESTSENVEICGGWACPQTPCMHRSLLPSPQHKILYETLITIGNDVKDMTACKNLHYLPIVIRCLCYLYKHRQTDR